MINWLRSILFVVWLYGWLLILGVIFLPTLILPRRLCLYGIRSWAIAAKLGLKWICGITTQVRGQENFPQGACLIASKHQSMYDTLMPFLYANDPAFVLKRELFFYPFIGWYGWKAGMIPIDRGGFVKTLKKMLARAKQEADKGRQILIFPEGTRVVPGADPDYKTGVYAMYKELDLPCAPIAVLTGLNWPRKGLLRKPGTIVFEILPPIEPGLSRKDFMATLQNTIEPAVKKLMDEAQTDTQNATEKSVTS